MEKNKELINKPRNYHQLIFDKGGKNIKWEKDRLFSKWCWENCTGACKPRKLEYTLISYTKISSKWFKDLNLRQYTIKLLDENIGKTFSDMNLKNVFSVHSLKATKIRVKINQRDLIKLTSFCTAKEKKYGMGENSFKQCNQQGLNLQYIQTTPTTQQQKNKTKTK